MIKVLILLTLFSQQLSAQQTPPAGPPWQKACEPIGREDVRKAFPRRGSCGEMYQKFKDMAASAPAVKVAEWLVANKRCLPLRALIPWLTFMSGQKSWAKIAWILQLYLTYETTVERRRGSSHSAEYKKWFEAIKVLLKKGETAEVTPASTRYTEIIYANAQKSTSYADQMKRAYKSVTPLCLLHKSLECKGALKQALDWMYPRSLSAPKYPSVSGTFSMVPYYRIVFNDSKTMQYASKLASYLLEFIGSGYSQRRKIPEFYELGLKAFNGDQDRFWSFMALLATRGSSFALMYRMAHRDTEPLYAALMVISASMSLLDTLWLGTGTSFSYAKGSRNTCFQGKPYHYWMAGSFSYLLSRKGYSKKTSKLVARLLGAMYEMNSQTWGRVPNRVFFVEPFAPVAMSARREMVHHHLGSHLGVVGAHPQNFDTFLATSLKNSKPVPKMPADELRKKLRNPATKWSLWTKLVGFYSLDKTLEVDQRYRRRW